MNLILIKSCEFKTIKECEILNSNKILFFNYF
jgi:hypothetical protein